MTHRAVVHIFGAMDVGGAETRTIELMQPLSDMGFSFHFVTLSGRAGTLAPSIIAQGGRVHPMRLSPLFPLRLLRLLRGLRPVAVDSHVATFSGILLFLARLAGTPVRIARFHSTGDGQTDSFRRKAQRAAMRFLIGLSATHIVGVSPAALSEGYRWDWQQDGRSMVIPNGVDLARLWESSDFDLREHLGIPKSDVICLHVGRASPEKNRSRVPQIVGAMRDRGIAAWGVLVGPADAADEGKVWRAAEAAGVAQWTRVLGARDDVGNVMRSADLLLLPSTREGLPGVILESLAVGTPVLASTVGGAVWIAGIMNGVRCLPLTASDAEWAEASAQILASKQSNGAKAREVFSSSVFALEHAAQANAEVYSSTLGD
jgi:glycosyltransferase involved in cell wall biosynthesis